MKDEEIISIPIYFKSSEDLYIGKCSTKLDKTSFKFSNPKSQNQTNTNLKYSQKEFFILNRDKAKQKIFYKGSKFPQDSNYILMKYNSETHSIQMCPSNEWINFIQAFNRQQENIKDIEDKNKEKIKEINKNIKEFFNFEHFSEMKQSDNPKRKTRKKKTLLPSEKEDLDDDLSDRGGKKKKNKYEFEEDSHSSENNIEFEELEEDENEKRRKEEEEMKKLKEEEAKRKQKEKNEIEEDEEDEDDDFKNMPSDVDENEEENSILKNFELLNKKRNREKMPDEDMKEELINLFRKKSKMTYEEIIEELSKKFPKESVGKYSEKLISENTKKFTEGKTINYFLK